MVLSMNTGSTPPDETNRLVNSDVDAQLKRLALRDHIIGLEATITRQQQQLEAERAQFAAALDDARRHGETEAARAATDSAMHTRAVMEHSRTWRLGRLVLLPLRIIKRLLRGLFR